MAILCSDERERPTHDFDDESVALPAAHSETTLGGWRPVSFTAAPPPPCPDPGALEVRRRSAGADKATRSVRPADRFSRPDAAPLATVATPSGDCKVGLAGLFSATPSSRSPGRLEGGMDLQPRGIRIETERLVLRILRLEDFEDYAAVAADPATFRYSERGPMTSDESWTRLLRHVGHWALLGWGLFAIEEKATGRFVGEAGLGEFRRGFGPHYDGVPEAGWTIARWAQGRGYATEAMAGALAWIEQRLGAERTVCLIHVDNKASIRVAEKLGYNSFADCNYRGYDALLFERVRA
jgi:RimJ/RimL family protein N-acetyltransferase